MFFLNFSNWNFLHVRHRGFEPILVYLSISKMFRYTTYILLKSGAWGDPSLSKCVTHLGGQAPSKPFLSSMHLLWSSLLASEAGLPVMV